MKVNEFLEYFAGRKDIDFVKELNIKQYVPFADKLNKAKLIANTTTHEMDAYGNITPKMHENKSMRLLMFRMISIDLWSDLEVDMSKMDDEFDKLQQYGFVEKIIGCIPHSEIEEFSLMVDNYVNDIHMNEFSTQKTISILLEKLSEVGSNFIVNMLSEVINKVPEDIDDMIKK